MQFSKVYTDEILLSGFSVTIPKTSAAVADAVGCASKTIERAIPMLESQGKIKRIDTQTGSEKMIKTYIRCLSDDGDLKTKMDNLLREEKSDALKNADALLVKIEKCSNAYELCEALEELLFHVHRLHGVGVLIDTEEVKTRALQYLDFGFNFMKNKIEQHENSGFDILGSEEYDLLNEFFQVKGWFTRDCGYPSQGEE